jgi:hypothetical protein
MVTIEVDEDNMEEIADEAATLYLTSMLSEWGAYYRAKSLPRFVSYDSLNPFFFPFGHVPNQKMKQYLWFKSTKYFAFWGGMTGSLSGSGIWQWMHLKILGNQFATCQTLA